MKESSRIKFTMTPDGGANTFTAQLELKVSESDVGVHRSVVCRTTKRKTRAPTHATSRTKQAKRTSN